MGEQAVLKWLFIFSIISLHQVNSLFRIPKDMPTSVIPIPNPKPHGHRYQLKLESPKTKNLTIANWDANIIINNAEVTLQRGDAEPGFDLTNEEMKKFKLWPKGIIPYYIDVRSYNDKVLRDKIRGFLSFVNGVTSLNFMELPSPPNDDTTRWVFFVNRRGLLGCADHSIKNFTNEGVQQVVLGYDCMNTGGELSEAVLAIAGVPPQHNAPNRDDYIQVKADNIIPEKKYLFDKLSNNEWLFHDVPYDFFSAGHYHYHKYSSNGRATIVTQENYVGVSIGHTFGFSNTDVRKLRMLYNYISKKSEDQVPECNKLFVPGTQFYSYRPSKKKMQPLKKPNKYLGLPDEEINNDNDDYQDKNNDTDIPNSEENYQKRYNDGYTDPGDDNTEVPEADPQEDYALNKRPLDKLVNKQVSTLDPYHQMTDNVEIKKLNNVEYMKFRPIRGWM